MENEKLFEFMEKIYSQMQQGFKEVRGDISSMKTDIKKIDFKIEDLNKKVDLSLEGHKTNTEQLNRIESEVSRHEEIILRRIK